MRFDGWPLLEQLGAKGWTRFRISVCGAGY
jgi:hypothetical protein